MSGLGLDRPLVLRPILKERVWGVERLPAWYPQPGKPVGEAWLTAEECVTDGGETLGDLARADAAAFGADANGFPLLIKMLFKASARQRKRLDSSFISSRAFSRRCHLG